MDIVSSRTIKGLDGWRVTVEGRHNEAGWCGPFHVVIYGPEGKPLSIDAFVGLAEAEEKAGYVSLNTTL